MMDIMTSRYEDWQNRLEKHVDFNICESMVAAFTEEELLAIDPEGAAALRQTGAHELLNYGWIEGSAEFKQGVAGLYQSEVAPDRILQTNGGTGANFNAMYALIEPGDHVIVESPAYEPLEVLARQFGAEVELWRLREEHAWQPDIGELRQMVRPDTKLIVLVNASNPLGVVLETPLLEEIADIARSVGAYVLCDEAFRPFDESVNYTSMIDVYEKAIVTCTLSKAYAVPGIRIGWVVADDEIAGRVRRLRDYTMVSCGVPNDALGVYVLRNREGILKRNCEIVMRNLEIADAWIAGQPRVSWQKPRGVTTGFMRLDIPEDDVSFCKRLAAERKTLLIPGGCFDLPCGARLGYCAHEQILRRGLDELAAALAEFD